MPWAAIIMGSALGLLQSIKTCLNGNSQHEGREEVTERRQGGGRERAQGGEQRGGREGAGSGHKEVTERGQRGAGSGSEGAGRGHFQKAIYN